MPYGSAKHAIAAAFSALPSTSSRNVMTAFHGPFFIFFILPPFLRRIRISARLRARFPASGRKKSAQARFRAMNRTAHPHESGIFSSLIISQGITSVNLYSASFAASSSISRLTYVSMTPSSQALATAGSIGSFTTFGIPWAFATSSMRLSPKI